MKKDNDRKEQDKLQEKMPRGIWVEFAPDGKKVVDIIHEPKDAIMPDCYVWCEEIDMSKEKNEDFGSSDCSSVMSVSDAHRLLALSINWRPNARLVSGRWLVTTIEGHDWPMMFRSKGEAESAAKANAEVVKRKALEVIRNG